MTRVVVSLATGGPPDVFGAQLSFYLAGGVDVVLVQEPHDDGLREILDGRRSDVRVQVVPEGPRSALAAHAVEAGADWFVEVGVGEFWWPRGESMQEVLAPMPPRYGIVQGLVREFVAAPDDGRPFWERMTVRRSLLAVTATGEPSALLRPAFRAHVTLDPALAGGGTGTGQPLRAWYPLEVLSVDPGTSPGPLSVEGGLARRELVVDVRLRDALDAAGRGDSIAFQVPDVVDDASYAVECAAVGEVDLAGLDRQIRELERRIVELDARIWPKVRRRVFRLARRPSAS